MANRESNRGNNKSERGFAAMDDEQQREIAGKGGKASHQGGRQNQSGSNEGSRSGGSKGGENSSGGGGRGGNR